MTAAQYIGLAVQASIFVLIFALGLTAKLDHVTYLFRHPGLLVRSILAMNIVMLAFVLGVNQLFDLPPPIRIALLALSVSPVPPVLPKKQVRAGGSAEYAVGLLAALAIVAIVLVPAAVAFVGRYLGLDVHMPATRVASIVMIPILIPLLAGIGFGHVAPALAARIASPVSLVAMLLLLVSLVPILFVATPALVALIGNGVLACLIAFALVGLCVGHFLGGPDSDNRTVLAIATAARHPGMAIAIASLTFPDEKAVMAVVLYHVILGGIVAVPYVKWRSHQQAVTV